MTTDRDFDSTAYGRGYKDGKRDAATEITRLKAEVERRGKMLEEAADALDMEGLHETAEKYRAALAPSQERHLSLNEQAVMHSALRQSVTKEPRT